MTRLSIFFLSGLLAAYTAAAAPPKARKHSSSVAHKTPGHTATTGSSRSRKGRRRLARAKPGPSYQLHPDAERYQQIQQALAERGYFKGEANGTWADDSSDALKRFQADKGLDSDGKISSRTLIDLGLGPKHDASVVASSQTSPPSSPESPQSTAPLAPLQGTTTSEQPSPSQ